MIKQNWVISSEERERILNIHETATKNQYLVKEQTTDVESTYGQCNGNNPITEPKIGVTVVTTAEGKPKGVNFSIRAYFPSTESSEKTFLNSLLILNNKIKQEIEKLGETTGYIYKFTSINRVIGSASNYLNGPLKPTSFNTLNGTLIPENKLNQPPYSKLPGEGNYNWDKNKGYAESRWSKLLDTIKTKGGPLGFNVSSNMVGPEETITVITDTGGCTDEKRDVSKYPNPGQYVVVKGNITLFKDNPVDVTNDIIECADGLKIVIGYFKRDMTLYGEKIEASKADHFCNYATFDILCNDIPIGISNMNNDFETSRGLEFKLKVASIGKDQSGYVGPRDHGETVYTVIDVPTDKLKSIERQSDDGRITISISGHKGSLTKIGSYHSEVPTVWAFVVEDDGTKRTVYGPKAPLVNMGRSGKKEPLATFNPCIEVTPVTRIP